MEQRADASTPRGRCGGAVADTKGSTHSLNLRRQLTLQRASHKCFPTGWHLLRGPRSHSHRNTAAHTATLQKRGHLGLSMAGVPCSPISGVWACTAQVTVDGSVKMTPQTVPRGRRPGPSHLPPPGQVAADGHRRSGVSSWTLAPGGLRSSHVGTARPPHCEVCLQVPCVLLLG